MARSRSVGTCQRLPARRPGRLPAAVPADPDSSPEDLRSLSTPVLQVGEQEFVESSMSEVQVEQKTYEMPPRERLYRTDVQRSLRFYETSFAVCPASIVWDCSSFGV